MSTPRWDAPWTAPTGLTPERPPGETGPGLLAVVHLAVFFGIGAVAGLIGALADSSDTGSAAGSAVVAVLLAAGGVAALLRRTPLLDWVADLLLASAAAAVFAAAGMFAHVAGASDERATLVGALVALPLALGGYVRHRRVWLQVATVAAAAGSLLAALAAGSDVPDPVYGAYLLVLAGFLGLGALSGVAKPVPSAWVLAALLATGGSQVLVSADALGGSLVAALVLLLVVGGVLRSRNRSLLPIALIAGVVQVPQLLSPYVGTGHAVSLSLTGVAAVVGWLAADLARRSPRPVQVGGVFAFCTVMIVAGNVVFSFGPDDEPFLFLLLQAVGLTAFFGAAASARRRPATVISGLLVLSAVPHALADPFGGGEAVTAGFSLLALGVTVWAAVQLDRKAPRPAASPYQQEVSLSGPGRDWTVVAPYVQVFDAVVAALGSAGVPLQLVDRAAGRVVAGDPVAPLLVVAVWATDPVRAHVRAVGAPADVDRLEADVAARTGTQRPAGVPPH